MNCNRDCDSDDNDNDDDVEDLIALEKRKEQERLRQLGLEHLFLLTDSLPLKAGQLRLLQELLIH